MSDILLPLRVIALLMAFCVSSQAQGSNVLVDFEDVASGTSNAFVSTPYLNHDFSFALNTGNLLTLGTATPSYTGSAALLPQSIGSVLTISYDDGNGNTLFTPSSIDFFERSDGVATTLTVTGLTSDNQTVSESFSTDGDLSTADTFNFSTFQGKAFQNIQIAQTSQGFQIDNFQATLSDNSIIADFEEFPSQTTFQSIGNAYTDPSDITFTVSFFNMFIPGTTDPNYVGTQTLLIGNSGATTTITYDNGSGDTTFTPISLDIAEYDDSDPSAVIISGLSVGGDFVRQSFTSDGDITTLETVLLTNFEGLEIVNMTITSSNGERFQIDNLRIVPSDDADNDGLIDSVETNTGTFVSATDTGTDPNNPDTDGDGLNDGDEVNIHNTDPNVADTDSDGLNDFAEINTHSTDPTLADSDSDGLNDGAEVNTHLTDPNDADSDGDGLSDGDEINTHNTNPNLADSDSDGLNDFAELNTHSTNPNVADSDDDGLNDGAEINTHASNPNSTDSDNDGFLDGIEVEGGTSPTDENQTPDANTSISAAREISFVSRLGTTYTLQKSTDGGSNWETVESGIPGTGARITRIIEIEGPTQFRVTPN